MANKSHVLDDIVLDPEDISREWLFEIINQVRELKNAPFYELLCSKISGERA
jgi:heat shock protein HspQ